MNMSNPNLNNPWGQGGSLASDWSANNTTALETQAVGDTSIDANEQTGQSGQGNINFRLPDPPIFIQSGATCWAAALASWISAFKAWNDVGGSLDGKTDMNFSVTSLMTPEEVIRNYKDLLMDDGSLPPSNWHVVAERERMDWATMNGSKITPKYIHETLRSKGYLYWAYQRSNEGYFSHVNVIHGVMYKLKGGISDGVYIMEPMNGKLDFKFFSDINNFDRNMIAWGRGTGQQQPGP